MKQHCCTICHGTGRVYRARAQVVTHTTARANVNDAQPPTACRTCAGTGLLSTCDPPPNQPNGSTASE